MAKILWADDEIDSLKSHIIFLKNKEHEVTAVNSGNEAIEEFKKDSFDIVFLDENMPGMNGLKTLEKIKILNPTTAIIMITKSEEEMIMEEAILHPLSQIGLTICLNQPFLTIGPVSRRESTLTCAVKKASHLTLVLAIC